jgi:hypothetical protein
MMLAIRLIEHKSSQTSFDSESFGSFKIRKYLEEVSIMKSVPNLISYLHKFYRIFIPFLSFSPRWKLISEALEFGKPTEWGPPVNLLLSSRPGPCARVHLPHGIHVTHNTPRASCHRPPYPFPHLRSEAAQPSTLCCSVSLPSVDSGRQALV